MSEIIKKLVVARKSRGLTQKEMGEKVGLPQSHISAIESGKVNPRLSSVLEMCWVLDQDLVCIPRRFKPAVMALISGRRPGRLWKTEDEEDAEGDGS